MDNHLPLVSIIVPVYNGERYLNDCLQALLAQTYPRIEIIVVNDGSTDNTASVAENYRNLPQVKIVTRPNGGLSAARNSGMDVLTGDWLVFVDVDDTIHPRLIEVAVREAQQVADCDVVIYDWRNVAPEEKGNYEAYSEDLPRVRFESVFDYYMANEISVTACRSLYRVATLGNQRFFEGVRYEDFDFAMRYIRCHGRGVHVKWAAYNYVQTPGSIIRSPLNSEKIEDMCRVLRHVAKDYWLNQDARYAQVRRKRVAETVKKMILKPIKAISRDAHDELRAMALRWVGELLREGVVGLRGFSLRWWPCLLCSRLAAARSNREKLPIYWCAGRPNFGDTVTPILMEAFIGRRVVWATKRKTRVLTIGSVLGVALFKDVKPGLAGWIEGVSAITKRLIKPRVCIWGSGFISDPSEKPHILRRHVRAYALRGMLTLKALREMRELQEDAEIPLGDPGILFDRLWPDVTWTGKNSGRRAYVPHECYWGTKRLTMFMRANPGLVFVDVRKPPKEVFKSIAGVAEVFSSSLHGLVAADSLGIPNRWVDLELEGRDENYRRYKFDDYYSAYGVRRNPVRLEDVPAADVGEQIPRENVERVKAGLWDAFEKMRRKL